ncbi:GntR family transcriptional regulator [Haematobacter massiliensis]|uniref:GntR family transcriptional regulator n=1 Tax=Haematobacter massiliensis TaxID=195105 RepID=UPI000AE7A9E7|nr:GntR family transcriptional regulator [Haematobacter massiliensis]
MTEEAIPADAQAGTQTSRAVMGMRDLIVTGAMVPGERFTEVLLAERLCMSRTPIRAAIQQLREEGLLEPLTSGGFTVRGFLPREIAEAIDIRGAIEGLAARLLAERGGAEDALSRLDHVLDGIDTVLEAPVFGPAQVMRYSAVNAEFHAGLVAATGSALLRQEAQRANARPFASASALVQLNENTEQARRHLIVAQDQHRAVLEAIRAREGARVEAILREHARLSHRNLMRALRLHKPLDGLPGASLIRRYG